MSDKGCVTFLFIVQLLFPIPFPEHVLDSFRYPYDIINPLVAPLNKGLGSKARESTLETLPSRGVKLTSKKRKRVNREKFHGELLSRITRFGSASSRSFPDRSNFRDVSSYSRPPPRCVATTKRRVKTVLKCILYKRILFAEFHSRFYQSSNGITVFL